MSGPVIDFPTPEEEAQALQRYLATVKVQLEEQRAAATVAAPALARLVEAMLVKTGQGYKLRGLLYSLWNGKPFSLSETLCLDWSLKRDFCTVMLGFGFYGAGGHTEFFYNAIRDEVQRAGLWVWFVAAGEEGGDK